MTPLRIAWAILLIIAAMASVIWAFRAGAAEPLHIAGRIDVVEDGDTLAMRTRDGRCLVIRLADFDAPETAHQPNERPLCARQDGQAGDAWPPIALPAQPGGNAAWAHLRRAAEGADAEAVCHVIDRYGRHVCAVTVVGAAESLSRAMVRAGMGQPFDNPAWMRDRALPAISDAASSRNFGIWALPPELRLTPGEWRRRCWGAVIAGRPDAATKCPGAEW